MVSGGCFSGRRLAVARAAEIKRSHFFYLASIKNLFKSSKKINVLTRAITLIIIILGFGLTGFETRRLLHFL
jgi:hypothetical protein